MYIYKKLCFTKTKKSQWEFEGDITNTQCENKLNLNLCQKLNPTNNINSIE